MATDDEFRRLAAQRDTEVDDWIIAQQKTEPEIRTLIARFLVFGQCRESMGTRLIAAQERLIICLEELRHGNERS